MEKSVSCVVVGATGRMGQRICSLIAESDEHRLAGATESAHSDHVGKNLQEAVGLPYDDIVIHASLEEIPGDFDVIIDFTFPDVSMETIRFAGSKGKRAVIGTTGFSQEQLQEIERLSSSFPCVCAPNMSRGVNTLFKLVQEAAALLNEGYDTEIVEIHHRYKKDAPSGTALRLAEIVADSYGRDLSKVGVYERKGVTGERKPEDIGIQTLRAGDVAGEHTVVFGGLGERLELVHRAHSRDCFVQGALYAARWLQQQPNGLYDMQDVLGLRS